MSETDPAAQAFDDLRAEVSVLRRAVEALPLAWRDNRPPDYTEDLARVVKAMNAVGTHMKAIEASPTLKMTPQAYGQGIREEGLAASRRLEGVFEKAIGEVRKERNRPLWAALIMRPACAVYSRVSSSMATVRGAG